LKSRETRQESSISESKPLLRWIGLSIFFLLDVQIFVLLSYYSTSTCGYMFISII
jgi:hypothetical protein